MKREIKIGISNDTNKISLKTSIVGYKPLIQMMESLEQDLNIIEGNNITTDTDAPVDVDVIGYKYNIIEDDVELVTHKIGEVKHPWSKNLIDILYCPSLKEIFIIPSLKDTVSLLTEDDLVCIEGYGVTVSGDSDDTWWPNVEMAIKGKYNDINLDSSVFKKSQITSGIMNVPGSEFSGTSRIPSMKTVYGSTEIENTDVASLFYIKIDASAGVAPATNKLSCFTMYPVDTSRFKLKAVYNMPLQNSYFIFL